uniref:EGF-like calcium-binding domain-containing protein n=1 Tax=Tetranychus urticae TaxID=32264 RepID=T1KVR2_TETUR
MNVQNGPEVCPVNSICVTTQGSFGCICRYRQSTYSKGCDDIDGCSFICSCPLGYKSAGDEKTCIDIDECAENIANLALFCEEGFQVRDNRFCDDINECERNKPCGESICLNTIGGYKCFNQDCPEGFIRDSAHTQSHGKPFNVLIPSSGKLALFTARGPLLPGPEVLFKLNVTSIEADDEQLAELELDLELCQCDLPSGTTKIILMLHISSIHCRSPDE